jgi:hypothetical protein
VVELRQVWQEALSDKRPGSDADDVLNRLERKYQAIADAAGTAKVMRLGLSAFVETDLDAIAAFIANDNSGRAVKLIKTSAPSLL